MSTTQDNENSEPSASSAPLSIPPADDWYLRNLVDLANRGGLECGITLTVGGTTITGTLVGGKKYFEQFGKLASEGWPGNEEDREHTRIEFSKPARLYESEDQSAPSFIHLVNAKIVHPTAFMPNEGMLWRGRLTAISGFALGSLSIG
ncbi:hypothetical protein LBW56_24070 [Ralstonia solanacearum]|uniref:gas vesicle accessory protein GvpU n=1 Tax=Ralstonia solanacearum TaxID=305 RepID=UPI001FF86AAA|nr:gas vesicle accessory protein GvpU [Ralstonia solanacearum]MDB0529750.1 hypothetical protein [Ralstonia solanacearum]